MLGQTPDRDDSGTGTVACFITNTFVANAFVNEPRYKCKWEDRDASESARTSGKAGADPEGIIDVALTILRDEGLNKVTMHRIAAALDTGAASLFVYVRDTEDLHAQILDALLGSVAASLPVGGNRSERLAAALTRYMRTLFNWPTGPNYLAFVDLLLALLVEGGVPDRDAAWAVDLLLQFATAMATEQGARKVSSRAADEFSALAAAITRAEAATYPEIARLGGELLSGSGATRFAWGLDVLIAGVLNTHRPPTAQE